MTHRRGNETSVVIRTTLEEQAAYQQAAQDQRVTVAEWIREACATKLAALVSDDPTTHAIRLLWTHWQDTFTS